MTVLLVRVKPNARTSLLTPPASEGEPWLAQLAAPPVEGKANEELIRLVARQFGCPRKAVRIRTGTSSRMKLLEVNDG